MKKYLYLISLLVLAVACGGSSSGPEGPDGGGSGTQPGKPSTPSSVTVDETSLSFSWGAVSGASSYDWRLLQGLTEIKKGNVSATSVTVSGLSAGTTYRFSVKAVASGGSSAWSDYVEVTTSSAKEEDPGSDEPDKPDNPGVDGPEPLTGDVYSQFLMPASEEDAELRAFPGAEGGGMYTSGGRGGRVIHVTTLADSGKGSLREALTAKGARIVVFDVAGIIELESKIQINNGDLTVAGQTAPGDGICIKNYTVNVNADNVIIRFLHFRLGDQGPSAGDGEDCIWGRYHSDIIIDHCSMSWSIDECASFYANENFSLQWCILTESMNNSAHSKGAHGYGGIWGGKNASFHHNLLANHYNRNARIDHPHIYEDHKKPARRGVVDYRNNVIYNWGSDVTYGGEGGWFNIVDNYYKPGPSSTKRNWFVNLYGVYESNCSSCGGKNIEDGYATVYISGNVHSDNEAITADNASGINWKHGDGHANYGHTESAPLTLSAKDGKPAYVSAHSAEGALAAVLEAAGDAVHRDAVDLRAVEGVRKNTGKIIDTPSDVGGWPEYSATEEQKTIAATDTDGDGIPDWYEILFSLDKDKADDASAKTLDKTGRYTNLEMYLHWLVKDVVAIQGSGAKYEKL